MMARELTELVTRPHRLTIEIVIHRREGKNMEAQERGGYVGTERKSAGSGEGVENKRCGGVHKCKAQTRIFRGPKTLTPNVKRGGERGREREMGIVMKNLSEWGKGQRLGSTF